MIDSLIVSAQVQVLPLLANVLSVHQNMPGQFVLDAKAPGVFPGHRVECSNREVRVAEAQILRSSERVAGRQVDIRRLPKNRGLGRHYVDSARRKGGRPAARRKVPGESTLAHTCASGGRLGRIVINTETTAYRSIVVHPISEAYTRSNISPIRIKGSTGIAAAHELHGTLQIGARRAADYVGADWSKRPR